MAKKTVTISKAEYDRLKRLETVDQDLLRQLKASFEAIKEGRVRRVA